MRLVLDTDIGNAITGANTDWFSACFDFGI